MIVLSDAHRAAIARHAEADRAEECCGLMLGRFSEDGTKVVRDLLAIDNARESDARRRWRPIRQVGGDEPAGEAGGSEEDDVEVPGFGRHTGDSTERVEVRNRPTP